MAFTYDAFEEGLAESDGSASEARRQKRMADRNAIRFAFFEKETELEQVQEDKATFYQYSPLFMLAGLKDALDLVLVGSLPVIGTIVTLCFAVAMFFVLMFSKTNRQLSDNRLLLRLGLVLLLGSMAEGFIFGINFLPMESITVLVMFLMDKSFSDKQIEQITSVLHILQRDHRARR